MAQEIAQLDDLKLKPLSSGMRPKKCMQTDIGEVEVTRTIFGRAKVRVIRKKDRVRRAWLLAVMVVSAALAATQQSWISIQQARLQQSVVAKLGWSFAEPIKSLVTPPVSASLIDAAPVAKSKPAATLQSETRNTPVAQKSASPQQPTKAPETVAVKPAVPQPLPAPKPQVAAIITAARPVGAAIPTSAAISAAATTPVTTAAAPPAYQPLAANSSAANTPPIAKISPPATIPAAVTAPNTTITASPAASNTATNTPPVAKTPSPNQEAASSSTADTPSATTKVLPPRLAATNISAAVVSSIVEPPSAQSTASVIQPEKLASEPGIR